MIKANRFIHYFIVIVSVLTLAITVSCTEKTTSDDNDEIIIVPDTTTLISKFNGKLSHHAGDNCQSCHHQGGNGKAWFSASGTVYDSTMKKVYPNALVKFYDGLDNTSNLVLQIEVDSLGNFYTTEEIDFSKAYHVEVEGLQIAARMGSLIHKGACNKCHGVTTNYIWTK